ncbi:DUF397 domain-containing protein [Streptomyces sp. 6N223]|uniref:DUF397 domain-containing protein n=1 Tax=Streptomyces sp. 6N223 TaxID=3457412 RepID=UPI003FD2CDDB
MSTCANESNDAHWFKSSFSDNQGGACLEAARLPNRTLAVRDSKAPDGPTLTFAPAVWAGFTTALASGANGGYGALC